MRVPYVLPPDRLREAVTRLASARADAHARSHAPTCNRPARVRPNAATTLVPVVNGARHAGPVPAVARPVTTRRPAGARTSFSSSVTAASWQTHRGARRRTGRQKGVVMMPARRAARSARLATSIPSFAAWAPWPRGPRPSRVGRPSEPGRFVSPAPAAGRPVIALPERRPDPRDPVQERVVGAFRPGRAAGQHGDLDDGARPARLRPGQRGKHLPFGRSRGEPQADLGGRLSGDHVGPAASRDPPHVEQRRAVVGHGGAGRRDLVEQLVDGGDALAGVQCGVRLAAAYGQQDPGASPARGLERAVRVRRLQAEDGHRALQFAFDHRAARRAAHLLVRDRDQPYLPGERRAHGGQRAQRHLHRHQTGLHVEGPRPGDLRAVVGVRHGRQPSHRPDRVVVADQQQVPAVAGAEGRDEMAVLTRDRARPPRGGPRRGGPAQRSSAAASPEGDSATAYSRRRSRPKGSRPAVVSARAAMRSVSIRLILNLP